VSQSTSATAVKYVIQKVDVRCHKPEENLLLRLRSLARNRSHRFVMIDLDNFSLLPLPRPGEEISSWEALDPNGIMGVT
jgi:hypothetical protein